MKTLLALSSLAFATVTSAGFVVPSEIDLFNTGVDASGAKVTVDGTVDLHWTVDGGNATYVYKHSNYFNSSASNWISKTVGGGSEGSTTSPAFSVFKIAFDLTGYYPSQTVVTGNWGTDNFGTVSLNGRATGVSLPSGDVQDNFKSLHAFTLSSGFVSGQNILEVTVGNEGGPGALLMEFTDVQSMAVPEPSVLITMMTAGSFGLLVLRRRR